MSVGCQLGNQTKRYLFNFIEVEVAKDRTEESEDGVRETAEVLHLYKEFRISRESVVKYRKDKQTNGICMTASELRQLWPVCQREDIRAGRKQRRRWKTWPEDINLNHHCRKYQLIRNILYFWNHKYQLGISYIFENREFNAEPHPKTSHVSGTPGKGAEGRENMVIIYKIMWLKSLRICIW